MNIEKNTLEQLVKLAKIAVVCQLSKKPKDRFPDFIGAIEAEKIIDDAEKILGEVVI